VHRWEVGLQVTGKPVETSLHFCRNGEGLAIAVVTLEVFVACLASSAIRIGVNLFIEQVDVISLAAGSRLYHENMRTRCYSNMKTKDEPSMFFPQLQAPRDGHAAATPQSNWHARTNCGSNCPPRALPEGLRPLWREKQWSCHHQLLRQRSRL
jgi:hypothetical protein